MRDILWGGLPSALVEADTRRRSLTESRRIRCPMTSRNLAREVLCAVGLVRGMGCVVIILMGSKRSVRWEKEVRHGEKKLKSEITG